MATNLTRIAAALALATAVISLHAPALAEETSSPYQTFINEDCGNVSSCFIDVPAPSKGDVVVTSIACSITALDPASRMLYANVAVYGKGGTILGRDTLIPAYTNTSNIGAHHSINTQTTLLLRAGTKVELTLSASKIATTIAECKFAGHFVK